MRFHISASTSIFLLLSINSFSSHAAEFQVFSRALETKVFKTKYIFKGFGCTGENTSPDISWKNPPTGTKSFAVTMFDPDAPTGSGWWHWLIANIPANVDKLDEGVNLEKTKLPSGAVLGRTDFGVSNYGGPCPPVGDRPHRYEIKVFALKVDRLDLSEESSGAMFGYFLNQNKLAVASVIATFGR